MKFKSIGELEKYLKTEIQDCLEYEVAEEVKSAMSMWAEIDVYAAYPDPKSYERRGSLTNKLLYDSESTGKMKITVKPSIPFNPYLATEDEETGMGLERLVTYGQGAGGNYGWKEPRGREPTYKQPRPWIPDAMDDLKSSGSAAAALAMGLQGKGITVK